MEIIRKNPMFIQSSHFTRINNPIKPPNNSRIAFLSYQNTLPNLSPAYFNTSFPVNPQKIAAEFMDTAIAKPKITSLRRAEILKEFYKNKGKGFLYLLPHEVWSDEKILDTVKSFGKVIDRLAKLKKLNKQNVQASLERLIPEIKDKIIIKDYANLEEDLNNRGFSKDAIEAYLDTAAFVISDSISYLYFHFEEVNTIEKVINLKHNIDHEIIHALRHRLQNAATTDICKNDIYKCSDQNQVFNKIFKQFENNYYKKIPLEQIELTCENMLNWLGFKSIEDLYENFEKILRTY